MAPSGTREGPFVLFKGWDIPGFDVSSQPHLAHNVDKLKAVALNDRPALITAFNSNGWLKSCNYLDRSAWREAPGCDLYIRVEYPGWRFIQGLDSSGNDLTVPQVPYSLGGIALLVDTLVHYPQELSDQVAGFNTNGWVKAAILPQNQLTRWSNDPLDGLYVREEFRTYTFFPKVDSEGGDIASEAGLHNNIPALISITNSFRDGAGFNTNGWIKRKLELPPRDGGFVDRHTGTYVRVDWPGFTFLPMLDSPNTDIDTGCVEGKELWELIEIASKDPNVVAFNTNGWLKKTLTDHPHVVPAGSQSNPLFGLYVKTPNLKDPSIVITSQIVEQYAFALKGQALIWAEWYIADPNVPKLYLAAVQAATTEIQETLRSSRLTPREAAERLLRIRTHLFGTTLHGKNSPPHRLINPAIKLFPGLYTNNIYRVSQGIYHRDPIKLAPGELSKVVTTVFDMASRSGLSVSASIKGLGPLSQIVGSIAAAVSIYQPLLREQWQAHIGSQVFMWSRSVSIGNVLPGVGLIVNPIGAILGGLAGWLTRECNDFPIANWFFGGSSDAAAVSILGTSLEKSQKRVQEIFREYNCSFYVQRISSHTSTTEISTVESATSSDNLIVTIIWLKTSTVPMPINIANPIDFNNLHFWLVGNLPLPGDAVNYVLGQGTEWHKTSVKTDTLSTDSVTVINSATTPTTTSFVPSVGFTRPTLPTLPKVSLSNVGEALLGVGIGGPLLAGGFLKHSHSESSENDTSASSNQAGISVVTTDSTTDGHRQQDSVSSTGSAWSNISSATQDSATTSATTTWSSSSQTEEKKQETLSSSSRWGFKKPKSPLPSPGGMFSSLKGAASEASSRVNRAASEASSRVKGAASDVSGRVADAQGRVIGAATDVTGRVVGTASSVGSNVYGAASNVSTNVQDRVTDTRESLSRHASEAAVAGVGLVVAGGVVVDQIFSRRKGDKGSGSSTTREDGTVIHSDQGHSTHEESVVYGAGGGQTTITKDTTTYGVPIPGGHTATVVESTHASGTTAEGGRTESQSWSQSSHTEQSSANSQQQSSTSESHSSKQYSLGGTIGGSIGGSLSTIGSSTISGAGSQISSTGSKVSSTLSGMFGSSSSSSNTKESSKASESHFYSGSLGQAVTASSALDAGGAVLGEILGHRGEKNETTTTTTSGNISKGSQAQSATSTTGYAAGGRTESYSSTQSSQGAVNQTSNSSTTEKHTESSSSSSAFRSDQKVSESHTDTRITTVSSNGSATESGGHSLSTGIVIGSVTSLGGKLFGGKKEEVKQETSTTVTYGNVATGGQTSASETHSSSTTVVTGSDSRGSQNVHQSFGSSSQYGSSTSASTEKHDSAASEKHTGSSTSTSTTSAGYSTAGQSSSQSEHTHGHSLGTEIAVGGAVGAVAAIGAGLLLGHKDKKDSTTTIVSSTTGSAKDDRVSSTSVTNTQSSTGTSQNVQGSSTESHQTSSTFGSSASSSDQRASVSRTSSSTTQQVSGSQQSQTGGSTSGIYAIAVHHGKAVGNTTYSAGDSQAAQSSSSTSESRQESSSYGSSQTSSSTSQTTTTAGETSTESRQGSSLGSTVTTVIGGITTAGVGKLFGQSGAKDSIATEIRYGNISNSATSSAAKTSESHNTSSTTSSQQQSGSQQSQSDDVTIIRGARLHGRPVDLATTVTSGYLGSDGKLHGAFESTTVISGSSTSSQNQATSSSASELHSVDSSQTTVVTDNQTSGKHGFFSGIKGAIIGSGAVGAVVETISNSTQSTVSGAKDTISGTSTSVTSTGSDTVSSVTSGVRVPEIHRPHLPSVSFGRSSQSSVVTGTESSSSSQSQQSSESRSSETSQSTVVKDGKESHKHGFISGLTGAAIGAAVGGALAVADSVSNTSRNTVTATKDSVSAAASSVTSTVTDGTSIVVSSIRVPEIHRPHLSDVNASFGGSCGPSTSVSGGFTSLSSQSSSATESHSSESSQTTTVKDENEGGSRFDILSKGAALGAGIVGGASSVVNMVSNTAQSTVSSTKDSISGAASSVSSTVTDGVSTITSSIHLPDAPRPHLPVVSFGRGSSETVVTGTTTVVNTSDSSSSSQIKSSSSETSHTTVIQDVKHEDHKHGLIAGLAGAAIGAAVVGGTVAIVDSVSNTAHSKVTDAKQTVSGAASSISSTVTDGVSTVTSSIHLPNIHRPHLPSLGGSQSSETVIVGSSTVIGTENTSTSQQSSEAHSSGTVVGGHVSGSYGHSIGISGGLTTSTSSSQTSSASESHSSESSEATVVNGSKKEGSRLNIFSRGTALVGGAVALAGSASNAVQNQVSDARNRVTDAASSVTTTISDGVSTVTSSVITGGKTVGSAVTTTTNVSQTQQASESSAASGSKIVSTTETTLQNVSSSAASGARNTLSRIGSAVSGVLGHDDSSTTTTAEKNSAYSTESGHHHGAEIALGVGAALAAGAVVVGLKHQHDQNSSSSEHISTTAESTKVSGERTSSHSGGLTVITTGTTSGGAVSATTGSLTATTTTWTTDTALTSAASDSTQVFSKGQSSTIISGGKTTETETSTNTTTSGSLVTETGSVSSKKGSGFQIGSWLSGKGRPTIGSSASPDIGGIVTVGAVTTVISSATGGESSSSQKTTSSSQNISSETHTASSATEEAQSASSAGSKVIGSVTTIIGGVIGKTNTVVTTTDVKDTTSATEESTTSSSLKKSGSWLSGVGAAAIGLGAAGAASATGSVGAIKGAVSSVTSTVTEGATSIAGSLHHHDSYSSTTSQQQESSSSVTTEQSVSSSESTSTATEKHHHGIDKTKVAIGVAAGAAGVGIAIIEAKDHLFGRESSSDSKENQTTVVTTTIVNEDYSDSSKISWSKESLQSSYSTKFFSFSQTKYHKEVTELSYEEFSQVIIATINSSFSSSSYLSSKLQGLSVKAKAEVILDTVLTSYRPLLAVEWHAEFEKQIEVWKTVVKTNDFSGTAKFKGAAGAAFFGLIAWAFWGLVEKTEETSQTIEWFFGGRSRETAAVVLGSSLKLKQDRVYKLLVKTSRIYVVERVVLKYYILDEEEEGPEEVLATIVWVLAGDSVVALNVGNQADLMFLLNWLAHTKPATQPGQVVVTPSAKLLAPPHKGLLTRLAEHKDAALAGAAVIAAAGVAGAVDVADHLKSRKDSLVEKTSGGVSEARTRIGGLLRR